MIGPIKFIEEIKDVGKKWENPELIEEYYHIYSYQFAKMMQTTYGFGSVELLITAHKAATLKYNWEFAWYDENNYYTIDGIKDLSSGIDWVVYEQAILKYDALKPKNRSALLPRFKRISSKEPTTGNIYDLLKSVFLDDGTCRGGFYVCSLCIYDPNKKD